MAHECPACGSICFCDCDDCWFDDSATLAACRHPLRPECQQDQDEADDDYDDRAAPSDALIVEITNTTLGDGETEADALRDLANLMDPLPADALREAAQAMLDAVDIVDADGELDGRIDGTLIDNLRRALTTPPPGESAGKGGTE